MNSTAIHPSPRWIELLHPLGEVLIPTVLIIQALGNGLRSVTDFGKILRLFGPVSDFLSWYVLDSERSPCGSRCRRLVLHPLWWLLPKTDTRTDVRAYLLDAVVGGFFPDACG